MIPQLVLCLSETPHRKQLVTSEGLNKCFRKKEATSLCESVNNFFLGLGEVTILSKSTVPEIAAAAALHHMSAHRKTSGSW